MHPDFKLFMKSANETRLYFRLFPKEFAFTRSDSDSIPKAKVKVMFRVTKTYSSIEILDSLSKVFTFKGKPRAQFIGFFPIDIKTEGKYIVEVFVTDLKSRAVASTVLEGEYQPTGSKNSFLFLTPHGTPFFYDYFSTTDTFRVRTEMLRASGIKIDYYPTDTSIPAAPDVPLNETLKTLSVDTSYFIVNPDTTLLSYKKEGVYNFTDNDNSPTMTMPAFNAYFPFLKTPETLLKPLWYLCDKKEMKRYLAFESPKMAVDSFWIKTAGDLDKARELIRIYYNRVQLANYYFTDYREGWLTDKGMVYVVFGAPASVKKNDEAELWIYGKGNDESMKFTFIEEKHPQFGKIYTLKRSELYARIWFNAIETWRSGRVFTLNP